VSAVPEEALKETAATSEPPNRLASPEFFFLLQRIDRLDEKLSREIKEVDLKLSARIDSLDEKLYSLDQKLSSRIDRVEEKIDRVQDRLDRLQDRVDSIKFWAIGAVITLIVGFAGIILTLLQRL
jgi:DNA repair exonuclease SbcCD ATPase subunit